MVTLNSPDGIVGVPGGNQSGNDAVFLCLMTGARGCPGRWMNGEQHREGPHAHLVITICLPPGRQARRCPSSTSGQITFGSIGSVADTCVIPPWSLAVVGHLQAHDLTMMRVSHPKKVLLAAPRGYCAGVDRAVVTVERALEHYGAPVYVRKQIVHNKFVVSALEDKGAVFVEEVDEVPAGATVIFSAHGVSPEVHQQASERDLKAIDATCPLVTKVHAEAKRFAAEGYQIVLIGHEGHEEVVGTMGEAPSVMTLVDGPDAVQELEFASDKLIWLSQTTLSVDETLQTVDALKDRFPQLVSPPSDDICYATQNRQGAVKTIAAKCDLVIVVGSANSSNSVRLVEVAVEAGANRAFLVDGAEEIDPSWLNDVHTIGVTSGASVPEILVSQVLAWLSDRGFGDVEEVSTAEEHLVFALPPELRRDMRGPKT